VALSGVNLLVAGTDAEHEIYPPRPNQEEKMAISAHLRTHV